MYTKFTKKQKQEKNGTVFIDRPLKAFTNVLNFLRNGLLVMNLANEYDKKMYFRELKFWGLPKRLPT
jgi:hypothetical protein